MHSEQHQSPSEKHQDDYDTSMAHLLVLVTHYSLTGHASALQPIIEHLDRLCTHSDLEFFPEQRQVVLKMRKLWLLKQSSKEYKH